VIVNESNAHLATALAGLGLIHTLDFMVRPAIDRGELMPILESWRPEPLDVYIVYPPSRQLSAKVRVFVSWITEVYKRYQ
jgi:DNA-binding transcriptional LysR family regulator